MIAAVSATISGILVYWLTKPQTTQTSRFLPSEPSEGEA
jgi:hypothetical protein